MHFEALSTPELPRTWRRKCNLQLLLATVTLGGEVTAEKEQLGASGVCIAE